MNWQDRLSLKNVILTSEEDWIDVKLNDLDMKQAEEEAAFQEKSSHQKKLNDNSIDKDPSKSLIRTIRSKQFEYAIKQWGGGTARVVKPNEFHDFPDVGKVNARYTFDSQDSLMIMIKDQPKVPIILGCGEPPHFRLMGWCIPIYFKQVVYRINSGRENPTFGFINNMQNHESCVCSRQWLNPMWSFNKELVK